MILKRFFNSKVIKCVNDFLQCSISLNSLKNQPDDYPIKTKVQRKNIERKKKLMRKKLTKLIHFNNSYRQESAFQEKSHKGKPSVGVYWAIILCGHISEEDFLDVIRFLCKWEIESAKEKERRSLS